MKSMANIFKVVFLVLVVLVLSFDALLYNSFEKQKSEMDNIKSQQSVESEFNSNKFKYQQDLIEQIGKDLEVTQQQVKVQKDALADQKDESKGIQTSLVDIKAETDAIKQDMKGWQKDYVIILAELTKKLDDSQVEIKGLENNLSALNIPELKNSINSLKADVEKITNPPDNSAVTTLPEPAKTIDNSETAPQV